VVSGSASIVTARQIAWAERKGWPIVRLDTPAIFGPGGAAAVEMARRTALDALGQGLNPVVTALGGPDDPILGETRRAIARAGLTPSEGEARIGEVLGDVLADLMQAGASRALICGGDTSGRVTRRLGVLALEPLAWIAHGASLMRGHRADGTHLEIILKGGQMGPEDLFECALGVPPKPGEAGSRPVPGTIELIHATGGHNENPQHAP
jgi:uncharacterized protein YgbK (DUF1537 family)